MVKKLRIGLMAILVSVVLVMSSMSVSAVFCYSDADCVQYCVSECTWQTGVCDTNANECVRQQCSYGYTCQSDSYGCTQTQSQCDTSNTCSNDNYYDGESCDGSGNCDEPIDQLAPDYSETSCSCYSGSGSYSWDTSYSSSETSESSCCLSDPADYSPDYQFWSDYDSVSTRGACVGGSFIGCDESDITTSNVFEITDSSGNVMAHVEGGDGDIAIREEIYPTRSSINAPSNGLEILDSGGTRLFKFENNHMWLQGTFLAQSSISEPSEGVMIEDSGGTNQCLFDSDGNVDLLGDVHAGCGDWLD